MNERQVKAIILCLTLVGISILAGGCGGSGGASGTSTSLGVSAAPQEGSYQASFTPLNTPQKPAPSQQTGSLLISVNGNGAISIAAGATDSVGIFVGATAASGDNTFSVVLKNTTNGLTTTATGSTYLNAIKLSLSGALTSSNITANFKGTNNLLAGTFSGTMSGGFMGSGQPMSLTVTNNGVENVSGTITSATLGALTVTGNLSAIGAFTASAPDGTLSNGLTLTGSFIIGANGKPIGSGTWTDSQNATNTGTWTATIN